MSISSTSDKIVRRGCKYKFREPTQITVDLTYGLSGMFVRRDKDDLGVRMEKKNAQQLTSAVTGAAEDRDPDLVITH